jgi:hypothetical protein
MGIKPAPVLAGCLVALMVALAGIPTADAEAATTDSVDPVVADVVRMLDVGVEPGLVLEWVKSSGRQPRPLTADDMIALSQANAPKELVQALLELSAKPMPAAPVPAAPMPGYAVPGPVAPPGQGRPPSPGPAAGSTECCMLEVSVEYKAQEGYEGDRTPAPAHDMYVYLDGEYLARITSLGDIFQRGPTRVKTRLAPGTHTVRLTRELHQQDKDLLTKHGWDHVTTVSPTTLTLTVDQVATYNLDIRWIESQFTLKRPMSWRWSMNGEVLASEKNIGESYSKWPYLCDDVEASKADGAIDDWRAEDRMKGCVTWASLWPPGVKTSRQDVLEYLARYDYSPPANYVGTGDW